MSKIGKKFMALFLSVMMSIAMFQPSVFAEDPETTTPDTTVEQTPAETTQPEQPAPTADPEPTEPQPQTDEQPTETPQPEAQQPTEPQSEAQKPSQPSPQPQPKQETKKEEPAKKEDSAKKEEKKDEVKYPAMTLTANAGGVTVTLQAPAGSLPEGTTLSAKPVGQAYINAVENTVEASGLSLTDAVAIDVTPLDKNGKEVQPKIPVTVTFSGANLSVDQEGSVNVYRVSDDAANVTQVAGGGSANTQTFAAEHFTIYVAGASTRDPNGDGSNRPNSEDHQYVLEYGQEVTLNASTDASTWGILSGTGVRLSNQTRTSAHVTNINETGQDQTVVIHHHRQDSTSREDFYILAKAQTHTVTFYLRDAGETSFENVHESTVGHGQAVSDVPEYPDEKTVGSKTYTFDGWYSDQACTTPADLSNITADQSVYAKYDEKTNVVTFMFKDAGETSFENVHESEVSYGGTVTDIPEYPDTKKVDGKSYIFEGWFDDERCTIPASFRNITEDKTVYARYTLRNHTVTFMLKDAGESAFAKVQDSIVPSGSDVEDAPVYPEEKTVEGKKYKFAGWFKDEACTQSTDLTNITEDQLVYARYAPTYSVTYHKNSGTDQATVPDKAEDIAAGSQVILGDGEREGYELVSWNTKDDGSGDSYSPNAPMTMPENDVDLYAQWSQGSVNVIYWRNYDASDTTCS
ncbi:MAG: InlB B-repeat-containing protein [Erysipelotrichaceae bacterium]|nr:InlB B-repeat-containing protein [Erysipelotrichaceae bacterium]